MTDNQKLIDVIEYVENALFLYGARAYYLPEHIETIISAARSTIPPVADVPPLPDAYNILKAGDVVNNALSEIRKLKGE